MNNKKPLGAIVLVLIALLAYFLYLKDKNVSPVNGPLTTPVTYTNPDLGFTFSLPGSWNGYSIIKETWQGNPLTSSATSQTGTKLLIRNPNWTSALPYQDIPILVFTLAQWKSYVAEDFSVSAAPILASELARNNLYVFALPPRWNFDYGEGHAEAEEIMRSNPLRAFNI